jgi:Fe-S-cluster containining protein
MTQSFLEAAGGNPCAGCSAPCCRMVVIPHPAPTTFMDLDYVRYMLGFGRLKMLLTREGDWRVQVEDVCGFLDQQTNLCTVHATDRQPKTCSYFNPHRCWYKRNFTTAEGPDLIVIDQAVFERILELVRCDDDGQIIEQPSWETIQALARELQTPPVNGARELPMLQP